MRNLNRKTTFGALISLIFLSPLQLQAGDFSYNFHLWNEVGADQANRRSPFNPDNRWLHLPIWSNSLVVAAEVSYRFGPSLKVAGSFFDRYDHKAGNHNQLRVKELYISWSINSHWDLTAGKKILKWGTGYAWTPTGVLDPPHDPRDPTDRLSQYEGREMIEGRGTYGNQNITAVFTSPSLFSKFKVSRPGAQWAVKYNALTHGLDFSLIASGGGLQTSKRYGANATYVIGRALELHGEFVAQRGSRLSYPLAIASENPQVTYTFPPYAFLKEQDESVYIKALVGINYTFPSGLNFVVEYYRDGEGLTSIERQRFDSFVSYNEDQHRAIAGEDPALITLPAKNLRWTLQGIGGFNRSQNYLFARVSQSRIARKWDLENIVIFSLRDGSSIWIPQVSYDFNKYVGAYLRCTMYAGNRGTEFGSLPGRASWVLGLALRF